MQVSIVLYVILKNFMDIEESQILESFNGSFVFWCRLLV